MKGRLRLSTGRLRLRKVQGSVLFHGINGREHLGDRRLRLAGVQPQHRTLLRPQGLGQQAPSDPLELLGGQQRFALSAAVATPRRAASQRGA